MRVTDQGWVTLAKRAGVRPPHIFHLASFRKVAGDNFNAESYAAFAMMDLSHVQNMLKVLDELPAPKPRQVRERAVKTLLAADWTMPEDWVLIARERRFWPLDVCQTEAQRFADWHRMKGNAFACWKAAWRNWIDGSRRENGTATADRDEAWTPERQQAYLDSLNR